MSRLWFISSDESHLLQFQPDRFIVNWRKRKETQAYPHFESIAERFEINLSELAKHLLSEFDYRLDINQSEITYINIIPVEKFSESGDWLDVWNDDRIDIEALNVSFNEVKRDEGGKPFARLNHQIQSAFTFDGSRKAFTLALSFKGKPPGNDIAAAMKFLKDGREAIVTRFCEITTDKAHSVWNRTK